MKKMKKTLVNFNPKLKKINLKLRILLKNLIRIKLFIGGQEDLR